MDELVEVPSLDMFKFLEMLNVDVLQAVREIEEEFPTEAARPSLLLDRNSPFFCEVSALLKGSHSVRLVQMVYHYVPSFARESLCRGILGRPAIGDGMVQPTNKYCLVLFFMLLPISTVPVGIWGFTYCAPVVIIGVPR